MRAFDQDSIDPSQVRGLQEKCEAGTIGRVSYAGGDGTLRFRIPADMHLTSEMIGRIIERRPVSKISRIGIVVHQLRTYNSDALVEMARNWTIDGFNMDKTWTRHVACNGTILTSILHNNSGVMESFKFAVSNIVLTR